MKKIDPSRIRTYSLKDRQSKVRLDEFAKPHRPGASYRDFFSSLPNILGARTLRDVAAAIAQARKDGRPVMLGMGAHAIKVGLTPVIIDLLERKIVTSVSVNGACIIHDFELSLIGQTSEDVDKEILSGAFGMAEETGRMLNEAIRGVAEAGDGDKGIGWAIGRMIDGGEFPYKKTSLLAAAYRLNVPTTVHVAIGTDIIHMHPSFDGKATGLLAGRDFSTFCSLVADLEGGVYVNLGSAVLLPEVFLKAVTLARNVGNPLLRFTTVNMDFVQHYRPNTNVVRRPTQGGGKGFALTGHHEIMLPLLAAAVIEMLS
jgi:deoxyhypusine synthase